MDTRTNNSAALPDKAGFVEELAETDMLSGDEGPAGGGGKALVSRKGLRDTGRCKGSRGEVCPTESAGDAARLRKGLFDERLRLSPAGGDCLRPGYQKRGS